MSEAMARPSPPAREIREPVKPAMVPEEEPGHARPFRPGTGLWVLLLAIGTAGALAHVAVRFKGLEVAYALGHERKVESDLEEQRRRLQIEIGMLKDPNRVVSIARDQLKMGPPAPAEIRRLGNGPLNAGPCAASAGIEAAVVALKPELELWPGSRLLDGKPGRRHHAGRRRSLPTPETSPERPR